MFNKKGVDAVVATVLIIMITVAAAAVIWAFVVPMIKESAISSTTETAKLSIETSGGYTTWDEVQKIARVQIKRGNDNVNLTGLDFNFVKQGNSKKNQTNVVPQPNQIKVYEFNLSDFGKPEKVSVAPITSSGVGSVVSESDVIKNYSSPSILVQNQVSCVPGLNSDGKIVICNCTDLQNMNQNLGASYILGQDIDCTETRTWNCVSGVCGGFFPVGDTATVFNGTLNGNGNNVDGINIYNTEISVFGFFGYLKDATVQNISFTNLNITCSNFCGGLVGVAKNSSIGNVYVSGLVKGSRYVGGLAGETLMGTKIFNSYSLVNVQGSSTDIGGLVGFKVTSAVVNNSFAAGNVTGSSPIGGLVGTIMSSAKVVGSYYYSHSGNPSVCVGLIVGGSSDCITKTDMTWFYSQSNAPMSSWDFTNVWQQNANSYPTLK